MCAVEKKTKSLLEEFVRGGELIRENAEHLYREACLLRTHGALARAAALHQLSSEECGKLEMLGGFAMGIALGRPTKLSDITKAFRKHEAKNHANAYFSEVTKAERTARDAKDWKTAIAIFRKQKEDIHRLFNAGKNASLYVDFSGGTFFLRRRKPSTSPVPKRWVN